jgi:hypothetical protein
VGGMKELVEMGVGRWEAGDGPRSWLYNVEDGAWSDRESRHVRVAFIYRFEHWLSLVAASRTNAR